MQNSSKHPYPRKGPGSAPCPRAEVAYSKQAGNCLTDSQHWIEGDASQPTHV